MDTMLQDFMAVILSGGQSRRMGQDKGLIQHDGLAWVQSLQQKLSELSIPIYVSIHAKQKERYETVLPAQTLIPDNESLTHINGPLKGILSAHQAFPLRHLLFLPCDMPLLSEDVFHLWITTFKQQKHPEAVVVSRADHQLQPLCGIYSHHALNKLDTLYQQGQLKDQSMHAIVENVLHAHVLEIPNHLLSLFKNYNTPDDLKEK